MRCNREFQALINKINAQKTNYSVKEMFIHTTIEQKLQLTHEKIKKFTTLILVSTAVMLCLLGIIFDFLKIINEKWIMTILIIVCVGIYLTLWGIEIFYKQRYKSLLNQKEQENKEKYEVMDDINSLNKKISSLVVSVITLNEHFYELSSIENEQELAKKWDLYCKDVIAAVNFKYNYHPTYEGYIDFYREYEKNHQNEDDFDTKRD